MAVGDVYSVDELENNKIATDADIKFSKAVDMTLNFEGGYTVDHAGNTNFGITQTTLDNFNKENGYPKSSVMDMTKDDARFLYRKKFFEEPKFDALPEKTAIAMFDYGVNASPNTATKKLQSIVGAKEDGILGPKTINSVNKFIENNGEDVLVGNLIDKRKEHYKSLIDKNPDRYKKYENGWMNRIDGLRKSLNISALLGVTDANASEDVPPLQIGEVFSIENDNAIPQEESKSKPVNIGETFSIENDDPIGEHIKKDNPIDDTLSDLLNEDAKNALRPLSPESINAIKESVSAGALGAGEIVLSRTTDIYKDKEVQDLLKKHPIAKGVGATARDLAMLVPINRYIVAPALGGISLIPKAATIISNAAKGTATGRNLLNFYEAQRYVSKAVLTGASFGTLSALKEAGIEKPDQNLLKSTQQVIADTVWGAGLGAVTATPTAISRTVFASSYGGVTTALSGGSPLDVALNATLFGAFEAITGKKIDRNIKLQAVDNIRKEMASYLNKAGYSIDESVAMANRAMNGSLKEAGGSEAVLNNNSAVFMNKLASHIRQMVPNWELSKPKFLPNGAPFEPSGTQEIVPAPIEPQPQPIINQKISPLAGLQPVIPAQEGKPTEQDNNAVIASPTPENVIVIPEFKNTEEALAFGEANKGNKEVIDALIKKREEALAKNEQFRKDMADGKDLTDEQMQSGMDEAVRGQFFREALEKANGVDNSPKIEPKSESLNIFTKDVETMKDLKNLIEWESAQQDGKRFTYIGDDGQRKYGGARSGHSLAIQSITPKKAFSLLDKAINNRKLTPKQEEAVQAILDDYRKNIKVRLEGLSGQLENNAQEPMAQEETVDTKREIRTFKSEEELTNYYNEVFSKGGQIIRVGDDPEDYEGILVEAEFPKKEAVEDANKAGLELIKKYIPQLEGTFENVPYLYTAEGQKALGMFFNGRIKIVSGAPEKVYIHEIGHAVFNMFLNPSERMELLNYTKNKYEIEIKDKENETKEEWQKRHDEAAEEVIMEEFEKYAEGKTKRSLPGRIKALFDKIISAIKKIFKIDTDKLKEFYDGILSGKYRKARFNYAYENRKRYKGMSKDEFDKKIKDIRENKIRGGSTPNASSDMFTTVLPGSNVKSALKKIDTIELVKLAKELIGKYPGLKNFPKSWGMFYGIGKGEIKLNPELFIRGQEAQLAATLAHEIGHLIDYLPHQTLTRGNLLGRLLSLRRFVQNVFSGVIQTNKELREEMKALSFEWRPHDPDNSTPSHNAYRNSGKEIYADFISALFNNPDYVRGKAPKAFALFFDKLDAKPEVKKNYFAIQDLLDGKTEDVIAERDKDIRRMFAKGEELRTQMDEEEKVSLRSIFSRIRQLLDDKNTAIADKINKLNSNGVIPKSETLHLLEERDLWNNDAYLMLKDIDAAIEPMKAAGLSEADLGVYVFLQRVIGKESFSNIEDAKEFLAENGHILDEDMTEQQIKDLLKTYSDREDIANPLGFSPETAKAQLEFFRNKIGDDKFSILKNVADKFREVIFKEVERAVEVGSYNRALFEKIIKPNKDFYVTFGVLNYLQSNVPAGIKMQKGTLSEIENPFITTILKTVSIIRLNARQRAVSSLVNTWKNVFPGEITESKRRFINGAPGDFIEPKDKNLSRITYLVDGKVVSYDVDKYIAESIDGTPAIVMETASMLNKMLANKFYKALFITYNTGFQAFNIVRDFKRNYINLNALGQKVTIARLLYEYFKVMPNAIRRQLGIDDALIHEMMQNKALDIPFTDFNYDPTDDGFSRILRKYRVIGNNNPSPRTIREHIVKGVSKIFEAIRFIGSVTESLGKIAGYNILKEKGVDDKLRGWITRTYIGTPNFRTKGLLTPVTNELFIFSNIMLQGLKSDLRLATHPTTRAGRAWADFKANHFWKILMFVAASGYAGSKLKEFYDKVPEYDKTNYVVVPLGEDEQRRARYLRIPHDETSRLFSAMLWKTMDHNNGKNPFAMEVFSIGAGNLPSISPTISLAGGWIDYLSGRNPFDPFRGRNVIPETAFKAKGFESFERMIQWSANEAGFSQFTSYDDKRDTTFEVIVKGTPFISSITRIIKTSDYGLTEKAMAENEKISRESAQEKLKRIDVYDRHLKNKSLKDISEITSAGLNIAYGSKTQKELVDIAREIYGDDYTLDELKKAQNGFLAHALKEENNPYAKAIVVAQSNEAKIRILQQAKDAMTTNDFAKFQSKLLNSKIISNEVIRNANR